MKEKINAFDYAEQLNKALLQGILLNTNGDKFNTMVIGWGHLGTLWNLPTYTVYVRQSRYTKLQLDKTGEFTISAPVSGRLDREVFSICGTRSGRDIDKEKAANLTLVDADEIVEMSQGIIEHDEVKILSGPLKGMEGIVKRINRHKRTAVIELGLFERVLQVEVGLEITEKRS